MDNDEMMVWKMDTTKTWENACKINRPVPLLAIPGSFDVHCKSGEQSTEGEKKSATHTYANLGTSHLSRMTSKQ